MGDNKQIRYVPNPKSTLTLGHNLSDSVKYTVIDEVVKSKMQFHIVCNIHLRLGYMMWVLQLLPVQLPYSRVELNTNVVGLRTETCSQDKKRRLF